VRLSVANNLNDIVKDNPETVIDLVEKWQGKSKEIDWIIKHGCRTLLKQGNPKVMELFGFGSVAKNISIQGFCISTPKVKVGNSLEFEFKLLNKNNEKTNIRLEYGIYYQKANGTLAKKVHKISEKEYAKNSTTQITRKHPFKVVTTRVLHLGLHQVAIIINGNEFEKYDFELI
jgi:3-methyladenine DNA glycosylase AlkC